MAQLIIECLCEELPYGMIEPALQALNKGCRDLLRGMEIGASRMYSTPRRLTVVIDDVAPGSPAVEKVVTGPPLAAAKRDGEWTKGAMGFARGRGLTVDDLFVVEAKGREVIAAKVTSGGDKSVDRISAGLAKLIEGLPFKKSMRWGSGAYKWGRPLTQVCAVLDGERIPAVVVGNQTVDMSIGHRRSPKGAFKVTSEAEYLSALRERWVEPDRDVRKQRIQDNLTELAGSEGLQVSWDRRLLEEVTDLVEWPVGLSAEFDAMLLELPGRLLVESMRVHQRYFPTTKDGSLTNTFLVVSNNPTGDAALIADGNRRVLAARFHDASFFLAEDRKTPLAQIGAGLSKMRWVRGLGTMAEKQARVALLGQMLAPLFGAELAEVAQAGSLCKADLLSQMVGEFTELQGHMGRLYAEGEGMAPAVALAIEEHYFPRYSGDALPTGPAGAALALADRLDTLMGCFSIGLAPKGSADPQGLRRAAIGVNAILAGMGPSDLSWKALLGQANQGRGLEPKVLGKLRDFLMARYRAALIGEGFGTDMVDAVLAGKGIEPGPAQLRGRVLALAEVSAQGEFGTLMQALRRPLGVAKGHAQAKLDLGNYALQVEETLAQAASALAASVDNSSPASLMAQMVALKPSIDAYFDEVMVMCEDPAQQTQRLNLMRYIANIFLTLADFRLISTE
ncbi:MAG: glycyl-tRNA synthetase beta chain [Cognaticolwellia sp.]|jgi:glycyl-tRNA synthetase beta chain